MFDFTAGIFGHKVIYLLDHDGTVTKRWAKITPFGLTCKRFAWSDLTLLLLPDGKIKGGPVYVSTWAYGNAAKNKGVV